MFPRTHSLVSFSVCVVIGSGTQPGTVRAILSNIESSIRTASKHMQTIHSSSKKFGEAVLEGPQRLTWSESGFSTTKSTLFSAKGVYVQSSGTH